MRVFSCINFNIYWINVLRLFIRCNKWVHFFLWAKKKKILLVKSEWTQRVDHRSSNFNWNLFSIMMAKGVLSDILWWYVFKNCASKFVAKVVIKERERKWQMCSLWLLNSRSVGQKRISKLTRWNHIKLRDWCRGRNMNEKKM